MIKCWANICSKDLGRKKNLEQEFVEDFIPKKRDVAHTFQDFGTDCAFMRMGVYATRMNFEN